MIPFIYDEAEFAGFLAFFEQLQVIKSQSEIVPVTEMISGRAISITRNRQTVSKYHDAGYAVVLLDDSESSGNGMPSQGEGSLGDRENTYPDVILLDIIGADPEWLVHVYQRKYGIPWEILRTERTIVREECHDDLDALYELYAGPGITDYIEPLFEREEEEIYLKNYIEQIYGFYEFGMWCVFDKKTGELIARIGIDPHEHGAELGYIVAAHRQNEGIATEVCEAVIEYAREKLELEKLVLRTDINNQVSVHIARKLGFKEVMKEDDEEADFSSDKRKDHTILWELEL